MSVRRYWSSFASGLILCGMISIGSFASDGEETAVPGDSATLADLAWIEGRWQGKAMEGDFESVWNAPAANSMMGMFKFMKDDRVVFYELLTIVEEEQGIVLRLKHFDAQLVGWEEKKESIEFPLVKVSENEATFEGLRFVRVREDAINVFVTIQDESGDQIVKFAYEPYSQRRNPKRN